MRCASNSKAQQSVPFSSFSTDNSRCLPLRRPTIQLRRSQVACIVSLSKSSSPSSQRETERSLDKAVGLIKTAELLAPFDRSAYSAPLVIWLVDSSFVIVCRAFL